MKKTFKFKNESEAKSFSESIANEDFPTSIEGSCVSIEVLDSDLKNVCCEIKWLNQLMRSNEEYFYRAISNLENRFWEHSKGHIPAIRDAGKMEEVLKILSLDSSFKVEKPYVSVSRDSSGLNFSV